LTLIALTKNPERCDREYSNVNVNPILEKDDIDIGFLDCFVMNKDSHFYPLSFYSIMLCPVLCCAVLCCAVLYCTTLYGVVC
jgi:hypothetical protein